jgi:hypothetical protein
MLHPYLIHTSAIHHPCLYPCPVPSKVTATTYTSGVFVFQRQINRPIHEVKNSGLLTLQNMFLTVFEVDIDCFNTSSC